VSNQRVVILGGYGTFGRLIAEELASSAAQIVIAGRDPVKGEALAASLGAAFAHCEVTSPLSIKGAIADAQLVINTVGPFPANNYALPQLCIDQGSHYIDLGDGREYVASVGQLHERALTKKVFVCVGASTTPAVTSAAVAELCLDFERVHSIKVALSAGNRNPAGVATIASILAYVGRPVAVWQAGRWQKKMGWGLGEFVRFPPPVGQRRVQLCDVPDLELFPRLFGADSVIFKAGVELTCFNYAIAVLGQLRRLWRSLTLPTLAHWVVIASRCFHGLGTWRGSVGVWVVGDNGQEEALAIVAPRHGPRVPCAPAVLLARKVIAGEIPAFGAHPCLGFIRLAEFADHLDPFGIFIVRGKNGVWSPPQVSERIVS
jgi:hypothetical protein